MTSSVESKSKFENKSANCQFMCYTFYLELQVTYKVSSSIPSFYQSIRELILMELLIALLIEALKEVAKSIAKDLWSLVKNALKKPPLRLGNVEKVATQIN
jgi:hypothetical protein